MGNMSIISFLVVVLTIYSLALNGESYTADTSTLILLEVLFRTGSRTPYRTWPTDEHANETYPPFGTGQLSTKGKNASYQLGLLIRDKYGDFLGDQYTADTLVMKHSNKDRTIMSAELVLAATYPPTPADIFNESVYWQPIPIWDGVPTKAPYDAYDNCPNYAINVDEYLSSDEVTEIRNQNIETFEKFENYTGVENATFLDLIDILITVQAQVDYGFDLPAWTEDLTMEELESVGAIFYELCSSKIEFQRLMEGYLLKEIYQNAIDKASGASPEERKLYLYAGNDANIASMLNVMNVWYRHQPPFSASIFFEVHNINGTIGLQLRYQDYQQQDPLILIIPGCDEFCPVDQLVDVLRDKIPTEADTCEYNGAHP